MDWDSGFRFRDESRCTGNWVLGTMNRKLEKELQGIPTAAGGMTE
jgi:hypothetical protein